MKRRWKIIILVTTLFLAGLSFVYYKAVLDPENRKMVFYPISPKEKGLLCEGDIILRKGYGFFSDALLSLQPDNHKYPVTHCAMLVKGNNQWQVIHSLSSSVSNIDGVQQQPLQRFLNESAPNSVVVVRLKSDSLTIRKSIERCRYYASVEKPFNHNFDTSDTTRFFCNQLFKEVYQQVLGEDIFQYQKTNTSDVYDLSTFFDSTRFEFIMNIKL